jgi:hypothetical protein
MRRFDPERSAFVSTAVRTAVAGFASDHPLVAQSVAKEPPAIGHRRGVARGAACSPKLPDIIGFIDCFNRGGGGAPVATY